MKIGAILEQIDLGQMALPEFQRGYVWNRDQVRGLMSSLYKQHPVGGLLVWATPIEQAPTRGDAGPPAGGWVDLLLDGQQRITTLYGIVRGKPPRFFDGNPETFRGLQFNMAEETFEFYAPLKMKDNPAWVDVTKLMQSQDLAEILEPLQDRLPELGLKPMTCLSRLNRVQSIKEIDLHVDRVSGADKTIDVVVDIFNRVNSGGTKLSKGDLALARICAAWPDARSAMKALLAQWRSAGFDFRLDWLLRCVTAVVTGEAYFSALAKVETDQFRDGLERSEHRVNKLLYVIAGRLGLDHGDVLGSPASFPLLCRYLEQRGGTLPEPQELDKLLYWYIHSFLWGRYAGSTESVLSQDLHLIENPDGALERLIEQLRSTRGDLRVRPNDFLAWSRGARFYPLLYMLTRVHGARDLDTGLELHKHILGHLMRLEVHHIFPKARLYKHGEISRAEVNSLGNFIFLTQETNLKISDQDPSEYLAHFESKHPGILKSQWIPDDPELWRIERYRDFLEERRILLASASNTFLDSLYVGEQASQDLLHDFPPVLIANSQPVNEDDEEIRLRSVSDWVTSMGLPAGELYFELADGNGERSPILLDLAWPDGLQTGYSRPVALLLDEASETEEAVNRAGYLFFTDTEQFRLYVAHDILAEHHTAGSISGVSP